MMLSSEDVIGIHNVRLPQRPTRCKDPPYLDKAFHLICLLLFIFGIVTGCPMPPPSPLNSRLINGKIVCDEGFELFGEAIPICKSTGDYQLPICAKAISRYASLEKSCSSTTRESNPSFKLDLIHPLPINFVKLVFGGETTNLDVEIRAGNNSVVAGKNPICKWETGPMNDTIQCTRPITAQVVFVQMVGEGLLQLCDIQIYSTLDTGRCKPSNTAGDVIALNSTCYELVSTPQTYPAASTQCTSRKGHLLSANYPITILRDKLEQLKALRQLFWIGVERDRGFTSRTWRWIQSGEVVRKPPWGKDQPNNYNREQNCVVLDGQREWNWNDVGCNLDMIGFICEFRAFSCSNPDRREMTSIQPQLAEYPVGVKIEYICPQGYFLLGDKWRECLSNSRWTNSAPSCTHVDCGNFESNLENGIVFAPNRTDYGAIITFHCHTQFTLVGVNERSCRENGKWSGSHPQCLVSNCQPPSPIINGTFTTSGLTPNSVAEYSCNAGSILIGSTKSTCLLGGKWEPQPPACQYIECGSVPSIENGRLDAEGHKLNSIAHVICDEGFWIDGDDTLVCTPDSNWSGHSSCIPITCPEPSVPAGAFVTGYDFSLHSEINYHCEEGHLLVGPPVRKCLNNGEWSEVAPICRYVDCGRPTTILHGQLNYHPTYLGSTIKYSCANNYKLVGEAIRMCREDGTWSGISPKCEEIRCPEPTLPSNSIISVTLNDRSAARSLITASPAIGTKQTYRLGSVIRYRCERGYKMIGESNPHTCIEGHWNGEVPTCEFVDCADPQSILNGRYDLSSNTTYLGSSATYECDQGWKLEGKERVTCADDGKWTGSATCKEIICEKLESENVLVTKFRPGGIATYSCPRGSEILGNSTRICSETGEWSGAEPRCRAIPCPVAPSSDNSRIFPLNTTLTHNTQIEYHCAPGFTRLGSAILTCFDGSWTPSDPPSCVLQEKQTSSVPIILGSAFGVLGILCLVLGIIYCHYQTSISKDHSPSSNSSSSSVGANRAPMPINKDTPMVMFEPHYYDNPTPEHIYEDVNDRNSIVTINGIALS